MTTFMIIVVMSLFMVLIGFTWYRLEAYEGMERIVICVAGILFSWIITSMLFSISSQGINYGNEIATRKISETLVLIFTPINGIAIMPYLAKIASQLKFEEITKVEAIKKIVIFLIILIAIFFVETKYLTSIQLGILNVANNM